MLAEPEALTLPALTALYLVQQDALRAFLCRKYGATHEQAEDICQDGYINAARAVQAGTTIPIDAARAWLWRIIINRAHDLARRAQLVGFVPLDGLHDHPAEMDVAHLVETRARISSALASLSGAQRLAVLAIWAGYHSGEIAEVLGESQTAIKMRVKRARDDLREAEARRERAG